MKLEYVWNPCVAFASLLLLVCIYVCAEDVSATVDRVGPYSR